MGRAAGAGEALVAFELIIEEPVQGKGLGQGQGLGTLPPPPLPLVFVRPSASATGGARQCGAPVLVPPSVRRVQHPLALWAAVTSATAPVWRSLAARAYIALGRAPQRSAVMSRLDV